VITHRLSFSGVVIVTCLCIHQTPCNPFPTQLRLFTRCEGTRKSCRSNRARCLSNGIICAATSMKCAKAVNTIGNWSLHAWCWTALGLQAKETIRKIRDSPPMRHTYKCGNSLCARCTIEEIELRRPALCRVLPLWETWKPRVNGNRVNYSLFQL